ncbi:hypothetical protein [Janthinobacterium sp. 75]|uniref:hypothetical protein n=1 Tax=unclassified Janthinobacterium TaxID=2610881 RepID=UPI001063042D|nr:hypothetical protein [Janthinobacterium sp. 75]TDY34763.1 hypothetical protein C8C89_2588 [Janthinobacterium sp. 75]
MNIFTKKIHAAPSAAIAARTTVLSAFAVCSVLVTSLALAQNQPPPRREDQPQVQAQRYEQVQRSNSNDTRLREQRDARSFDTRAEEQRRASEGAEASRRTGRMTPDERRDLRRQINEVGQDIYSNPPRR